MFFKPYLQYWILILSCRVLLVLWCRLRAELQPWVVVQQTWFSIVLVAVSPSPRAMPERTKQLVFFLVTCRARKSEAQDPHVGQSALWSCLLGFPLLFSPIFLNIWLHVEATEYSALQAWAKQSWRKFEWLPGSLLQVKPGWWIYSAACGTKVSPHCTIRSLFLSSWQWCRACFLFGLCVYDFPICLELHKLPLNANTGKSGYVLYLKLVSIYGISLHLSLSL